MVTLNRFASLMLAVVIGGGGLLATAPSAEAQQTRDGYRFDNSNSNRSGWSNRGSYNQDEQYNHRGRTFQGDNFGGFDVAPAGQFQQKYNRSKQLRRGGFGDRLSQNELGNQNLAALMAAG